MGWYPPSGTSELFRAMPKIELHRHLEGSLRIETLLDIAYQHGITVPLEPSFRKHIQVQSSDPLTFANFLSKFQPLRTFYKSKAVIQRVTREAIEDAAQDNIRYLELRFTPVALSRIELFALGDVIEWVSESAARAAQDFNVLTRLILSVNRHEPLDMAQQVLDLAPGFRDRGVVGVDLAGNEAQFSAIPFQLLFNRLHQEGLFVTIHAGEWAGAQNVQEAIVEMQADRIGHGVRVLEDAHVLALARSRRIPFEVCVTSNHQSGVVNKLGEHPIKKMLEAGLVVTINSDDPAISQITLGDEFRLLQEEFQLPYDGLLSLSQAALQASFLSASEKQTFWQPFSDQFRAWQQQAQLS